MSRRALYQIFILAFKLKFVRGVISKFNNSIINLVLEITFSTIIEYGEVISSSVASDKKLLQDIICNWYQSMDYVFVIHFHTFFWSIEISDCWPTVVYIQNIFLRLKFFSFSNILYDHIFLIIYVFVFTIYTSVNLKGHAN